MAIHDADCKESHPDCPCLTCRKDNDTCCFAWSHGHACFGCMGDGDRPDYEPEETEGEDDD